MPQIVPHAAAAFLAGGSPFWRLQADTLHALLYGRLAGLGVWLAQLAIYERCLVQGLPDIPLHQPQAWLGRVCKALAIALQAPHEGIPVDVQPHGCAPGHIASAPCRCQQCRPAEVLPQVLGHLWVGLDNVNRCQTGDCSHAMQDCGLPAWQVNFVS